MAINKLKSGKYQVRISIRNSDGTFSSHKKSFNLKREAEAFYRKYKEEKEIVTNNNLTYKQIFEESIKAVESTVLPRSIQEKRRNAEMYWSHLFDKKYTSITKKDWLKVWTSISNADKSYATKNKAIKYMKSVAKFAYKYYDLQDNTKHLPIITPTSDDIKDVVVWNKDQFDCFIDFVDNHTYKALFIFYFETGVTLSEALAIKKSNLLNNVVSIETLLESKEVHKRLKNRFRKRKITLANTTLNAINDLISAEGEYLFGGIEPLSNRTVPRQLKKYIDLANEELIKQEKPPLPNITIHGFRHSHATNLINNGVNIVAVSRRLGHSNIQTTLNTYTHLLKGNDHEILSVVETGKMTKNKTLKFDELKELKKLYDDGLLTDNEFETMKKELINS